MVKDIWIFLFALGLFLFSWPIMSIFGHKLAEYLFIAWFIFIVLIFTISIYIKKGKRGG